MSKEKLYEIGEELNRLHQDYLNEDNPRLKKDRYKRYFEKAEEYKIAFRSFMHSTSAKEVVEML